MMLPAARRSAAHAILVVLSIVAPTLGIRHQSRGVLQATELAQGLEDYYVFVKRWDITVVQIGAAYHTELAFCRPAYKTETFEEWSAHKCSLASEFCATPAPIQRAMYNMIPSREEQVFEFLQGHFFDYEMQEGDIEAIKEDMPHCFISGFMGVFGGWKDFTSNQPVFYQGPVMKSRMKLFYAGHVILQDGLAAFLNANAGCGNWENSDYHLLQQNCNYYTHTVLDALHMYNGQVLIQPEKLVASPWLSDFGRFDVRKKECVGIKCTAVQTECPTSRKCPCTEATCHNNEVFDPTMRSCMYSSDTID